LLNRTVEYPVYVVDRLHEQFILGIDFLVDENLGYCPKHRVSFTGVEIARVSMWLPSG